MTRVIFLASKSPIWRKKYLYYRKQQERFLFLLFFSTRCLNNIKDNLFSNHSIFMFITETALKAGQSCQDISFSFMTIFFLFHINYRCLFCLIGFRSSTSPNLNVLMLHLRVQFVYLYNKNKFMCHVWKYHFQLHLFGAQNSRKQK